MKVINSLKSVPQNKKTNNHIVRYPIRAPQVLAIGGGLSHKL